MNFNEWLLELESQPHMPIYKVEKPGSNQVTVLPKSFS